MLAATHTDFAPWTLVDFNDQQVGRLTLLRDFLDRVPDTELAAGARSSGRRSSHPPSKERYGVLEPICRFSCRDRHRQRDDDPQLGLTTEPNTSGGIETMRAGKLLVQLTDLLSGHRRR